MKADLHIHSTYSKDGKSTPEEIVNAALEKGLGCIAVTDHNEFRAHIDLKDETRIIVIPAEEVSSAEGHIVALGIDREIPRGMSIIETIDAIHEAGGLAIAAHPYRWWSGLGEKNVIPEFDGVEALNARSTPVCNKKSEILAKSFGPIITAGSDAHTPNHVGDGYTVISDECKTWQDVMEEIKAGRVEVFSSSRSKMGSVKYGTKTVFKWTLRGFKDI